MRCPNGAAAIVFSVVGLALSSCSTWGGGAPEPPPGQPDVRAARDFDAYPLYWLGLRFERWDLYYVSVGEQGSTSVYGKCEISDPDGLFGDGGSCTPPLAVQIRPLCAHLGIVARDRTWEGRAVRGAPVGTHDAAPVLFTDRVQVKVYRGQGSDGGSPMRALRALRSANDAPPVIDPEDPIPAPSRGVLTGRTRCQR